MKRETLACLFCILARQLYVYNNIIMNVIAYHPCYTLTVKSKFLVPPILKGRFMQGIKNGVKLRSAHHNDYEGRIFNRRSLGKRYKSLAV